jgi:hypothetical protein
MAGRPKDQAPPGHLTVREAAQMLEITASAVRQRIENGSLAAHTKPTRRKEPRYYIPKKNVVEAIEKDREAHLKKLTQGGSVAELAARLDALSERQENFEQTVREFLTTVRDEVPMPRSDKQEIADKSVGQEERNGLEIAYERADDPEFLELVGRDVRGDSTPEEHAFLRSPEGTQLWRDGLKAILRDLETQNIQRKADAEAFRTACMKKGPSGKQEWFEYKASWDAWKGGAARFKRSVQISLAEAKRLAQERQQHDEKERFRQLLVESLNFLNQDEAITYNHTPDRDALREKISSVLYKRN